MLTGANQLMIILILLLNLTFFTYSGKWVIQPYNIFDPYSGIMTNMSEGMITVIKRLIDWTEVPVDSAALAFHFLQILFY